MIFLDSDIISYYISGSIKIRDHLHGALISGDEIAITIINVYEIIKGYRYKNNKRHYKDIKQLSIKNWME